MDGLRIINFCWNTESLLIAKDPNGLEATLTTEDRRDLEENRQAQEEYAHQNPEEAQSWYNSGVDLLKQAGGYISQGTGYVGNTMWSTFSYARELLQADFLDNLTEFMREHNPHIVCITLNESAKPGDYLISHILPAVFLELGYTLQKRDRFIGVGVSTFKVGVSRGTRMGIFLRQGLQIGDKIVDRKVEGLKEFFDSSYYSCDNFQGKGGLAIYMNHPNFGRIGFVGLHLPHNAKSIRDFRDTLDDVHRQDSINHVNTCYNGIVRNLVYQSGSPLSAVFIMGDFNYRIQAPSAAKFTRYMMSEQFNPVFVYQTYDEMLKQTQKRNIYPFVEGIDGVGPQFRPTCKMTKGRSVESCSRTIESGIDYDDEEQRKSAKVDMSGMRIHQRIAADRDPEQIERCWNLGKYDQRVPSWCDRIVYQAFEVEGHQHNVICQVYDRYDHEGTMTKSDHTGVYGLFIVE
jgi:hypothetical protein